MERVQLADDIEVLVGDCRKALRLLPDESVQCVATSPPYFGLRNYGVVGQIGLEPSVDAYVQTLVEVFREVLRVLRKDGVVWLNLGDSYNGSGGAGGDYGPGGLKEGQPRYPGRRLGGLKPKDLIGVPWRVAFALQADGWYLRSDVIWDKPNPMPESVTDRPTKAHEYVFLLSKSATYFYDAAAVSESTTTRNWTPATGANKNDGAVTLRSDNARHGGGQLGNPYSRNRRTVWSIATEPTPFAHFATWPRRLVEPMVLAGTSPQACEHCGAPWERVVDRIGGDAEAKLRPKHLQSDKSTLSLSGNGSREWAERGSRRQDKGFRPTCSCKANDGSGRCVVLDPFAGSGTTLMVAAGMGRRAIGIELNPAYLDIMRQRLASTKAQRTLQL